jgi:phospholipid-binding lipoprotein MlaA
VRFKLGFRSGGLLVSVLVVALSGCSTFSGSESLGRSELLAGPPLPAEMTRSTEGDGALPVVSTPVAAAIAAETRVDSSATPPRTVDDNAGSASGADTVSAAVEPVPAVESSPTTSTETLVSQAAPVDVAQTRSGSEPGSSETQIEEYDPWEPFNEKMFKFNYNFDKYLLKPVAKGYNFIVPDRVQQMIGNGFDNIKPVPKWVNNLLQLNFKGFAVEMGRFLINSTFGIGGLFDIAKQEFGLEKTKVDFGQTLGKWGVEPGPYLILPFLPPLTVRDGIGYGVDSAMDPLGYFIPFIWDRLGMKIGETINDRSLNLDLFQGFEETTVDIYSAVRNGYLQRRYNLIHQGP